MADITQIRVGESLYNINDATARGYFSNKSANTVLAAPNGSAGNVTARKLVAADIPALTNTQVKLSVDAVNLIVAQECTNFASGWKRANNSDFTHPGSFVILVLRGAWQGMTAGSLAGIGLGESKAPLMTGGNPVQVANIGTSGALTLTIGWTSTALNRFCIYGPSSIPSAAKAYMAAIRYRFLINGANITVS